MTSSYHPQCNGMVERLHRQLKAAIMCHANPQWTEVLPLVLLGIRSAWKEDLGLSSAELVYGEALRLPGEFFNPPTNDRVSDPAYFADRLRNYMSELSPTPSSRRGKTVFYIPKDLSSADYVFLRRGTMKRSLEQPYTGPYKVLERGEKNFKLEVKGKPMAVTIDRLKPAYIFQPQQADLPSQTSHPSPPSHPSQSSQPSVTTRSGRRVRFLVPYQAA
ncbi:uncharacterized protein LOC123876882 [Maniola jurtina]|uniref:uncharacterized protein LOC123876882 n=1 Tax=Maniola jurtina TaxID=191418 RepID=UPI001E687EEE|nr:uncharacterized protein LOC123876882 [Maniola jurtina]